MEDKEIETVGLYGDGELVVVDLQQYQFPNCCLISGERLATEHLPIIFYSWAISPWSVENRVKDAVKSTWWLGPVQLTGIALRAATSSTAPGRSSLPGICLLALGMLVSIVGTVLTFVGCIFWQWPWAFVVLTLVLGSVISITGIFVLVRKNLPLQVLRFDHGFAWLAGVHPRLLDALPRWHNSPAAKAHGHSHARHRLGMGGLALLIGAIATVPRYQTIVDSISSRNWQAAPGVISSSEVVTRRTEAGKNNPARTEHVAQVNYTFRVAGAEYSGNRMSFGPPSAHPARKYATHRLELTYPVGKPATVYYHPRDPSRCTLRIATWGEVFQSTWPSLLALAVGTWGLTTGGIFIVRVIRATKFSS